MATIVSATEVRYVGDWTSSKYSDGMLHAAPFIPAGDKWLDGVCANNGYTSYATCTSTATPLLRAAECYFVAGLVVSIPPKDDFQAGPVRSFSVNAKDKVALAEYYTKMTKEMLDKAGFVSQKWDFTSMGGADYHPSGYDETNVDFRYTDETTPFDFGGGEE